MIFQSGTKLAEYYYNGQYWRVKTNCRLVYSDFEIVRFNRTADETLELEKDWEDFLIESTQSFRILMDPFRKNSCLLEELRNSSLVG